MGYGATILFNAGAREVVGVDIAEAVLEAARPAMPKGVDLELGDLRALDAGDDSFELVVCLETIEHLADPGVVLDELARVLAPGGLLALSSPNRLLSAGANPHHHHEYAPGELQSALACPFCATRDSCLNGASLARSSARSTIRGTRPGLIPVPDGRRQSGAAHYLLAIAGDRELPELRGSRDGRYRDGVGQVGAVMGGAAGGTRL